jgi:hypothetical protein
MLGDDIKMLYDLVICVADEMDNSEPEQNGKIGAHFYKSLRL